jgi:RNA recognition motif-containing protein
MALYFGNLSYEVTKEKLMEVCKPYGTVVNIVLPTDKMQNDRPKGFGFVTMKDDEEEDAILLALGPDSVGACRLTMDGRDIRVSKAEAKPQGGSGGGSGGGFRSNRTSSYSGGGSSGSRSYAGGGSRSGSGASSGSRFGGSSNGGSSYGSGGSRPPRSSNGGGSSFRGDRDNKRNNDYN